MKIGILTFGGGDLDAQTRLATELEAQDHRVVVGEGVIASAVAAGEAAERLARAHCDGVVFLVEAGGASIVEACCPAAALHVNAPILLLGSSAAPSGVFAGAGALGEIGVPCACGFVTDESPVAAWIRDHEPRARQRGEDAAQSLYGTRFGALGVPAEGVDTGRWISQFGVAVRQIGERALRERARQIASERVEETLNWLGNHCADIAYDGHALTRGLDGTLAGQARVALGVRDLCADEGIAFCALPDVFPARGDGPDCSLALVRALLGDGADGKPERRPMVCAPGGDANGALGMQLLYLISGAAGLGGELSGYRADSGRFELADEGGYVPRFVGGDAGEKNWRAVTLVPARNGGAAVRFPVEAAVEVTAARITRRSGRFFCVLVRGTLDATSGDAPLSLRLDCGFERFAQTWGSRFLHAVPGDHLGAMKAACEALDIEAIVLR